MNYTKIPTSFIYPEIKPTDFMVGKVTELPSVPIKKSRDWRNSIPPFEEQNKNGVESSACYKEAQQHAIAVIQEELYRLADQNYSARFNDQEHATPQGGSPINAADSFRHDGLIPDDMLPFSDDIKTWEDFNSFLGGNEALCRQAGKTFLEKWEIKYHIVFQRHNSIEEKYERLKKELESGPVPMSVHGWMEENGIYVKAEGLSDNHMVLCLHVDEDDSAYILDTYKPFIKKLEPFYNSDFGLGWRVERKEVAPPTTDIGNILLTWIERFFGWLKSLFANFKWI